VVLNINFVPATDVNECLNNNGGCSHKCVNMAGTYHCECPVGYTLHSNGQDCDLISKHIPWFNLIWLCTYLIVMLALNLSWLPLVV